MTIWSVTFDTDAGISTALHMSEREAYESIALLWFPSSDEATNRAKPIHNAAAREAMLSTLQQSTSQAAKWFENYLEKEDRGNRVVVECHDVLFLKVAPTK